MNEYDERYEVRKQEKARLRKRKRCIRRVLTVIALILAVGIGILIGKGIWGSEVEQTVFRSMLEGDIYPPRLIQLAEDNPETLEFLLAYPEYAEDDSAIDISADVCEGKIPLFLQWDKRWGYKSYGEEFLAVTGCGPTCLAMVYCGLKNATDQNPYSIACMAEAQGYYVKGSGSAWSMMTELASKLGLEATEAIYDAYHIRRELEAGHPIICIMGPGDFTDSGHYIVLTGVNEDGRITINDPNSIIKSEQTWDLEAIMPQMKNLWKYNLTNEEKGE